MTDKSHVQLSRRHALQVGGVGLAVLAGLQTQTGLAQQSDVPAVVRAFIAGWKALDADQIAQTYASAASREDITSPVVFQGRDQIRRSLVAFFAAFENASIEHPDILAAPSRLAADTWKFSGNYVGTLPGFPSGSGQLLSIQGFTLIDIANDEIQRTVDYYDAYGLLVQLGAQTAATAATPEATPTDG